MKKLGIVMVFEGSRNGIEQSNARWANLLCMAGHTVITVMPDPADSSYVRPKNVILLPSKEGPTYRIADLGRMPEIRAILDKALDGASALHVHNPSVMCAVAADMAHSKGVRVVGTFHTFYHQYTHYIPLIWRQGWPRKLGQLLLRPRFLVLGTTIWTGWFFNHKIDRAIAATQVVKDVMAARYAIRKPIAIIPTPARAPEPRHLAPEAQAALTALLAKHGIEEKDQFFLYAGRLSPEKSLEVLLAAFTRLAARFPTARLVIAGEGDASFAATYTHPAIKFIGWIDPDILPTIYARAQALILPSGSDTQALGILDALASGTQVITTDEGGPQTFVIPDKNGHVFRLGDSAALEEVMTVVLADPRDAAEIASVCTESAAPYLPQVLVPQLVETYT